MTGDNGPLVSIVTPTYNQVAFLKDAIESVLTQDYPWIDYLVIDDGSTDETRSVLGGYGGRLAWRSHANQGQTATINAGWRDARGEVLAWLNSDDTLLPGAVSTVMSYLQANPSVAIVFGDTVFTDSEGRVLRVSALRAPFDYDTFVIEAENPIPQPSAFVRRRVIEDVGLLDPQLYYFMDWEYWLRAGIRHRIAYLPERLSTYRLHPASKTVAKAVKVAPELSRLYEAYFCRKDVPLALKARSNEAVANAYFTAAGYFWEGGRPGSAAWMALRALARFPPLLLRPRMLRKFLFCTLGWTRLYGIGRATGQGPRRPGES